LSSLALVYPVLALLTLSAILSLVVRCCRVRSLLSHSFVVVAFRVVVRCCCLLLFVIVAAIVATGIVAVVVAAVVAAVAVVLFINGLGC
jgi:hypothetical protein